MRNIFLKKVMIGDEPYFRLTIGNSTSLLTVEEAKLLSTQVELNSNEIFGVPF